MAWSLASVLFSWRVAGFEDYPGPTGALGEALLMWLSATIIIVGAELNSEAERRR